MSHRAAEDDTQKPEVEDTMWKNAWTAAAMALMAAAFTSGCGVFPQPVALNDSAVTTGSLRVLHRFGGGPGGLEADYQGLRAKGTQALATFSDITFDGNTITGPALLDHQVSQHHGHLVYNRRLFAGHPVQMEWFAGAAAHRLSWSTASRTPGAPGLQTTRSWVGATGGVTGVLAVSPALELQLRYSGAVSVDSMTATRNAAELVLAWAPVPALQLRLGYGQNQSNHELVDGNSDLRLRSRGPFAGLQIGF